MITILYKLPDISQYMQYMQPIQLSSDITILCVYKTMMRDDDVILDVYLNEIAEETKIISGKKITSNALLCLPKPNIGFNYYINCIDSDGVNTSVKKTNLGKFYLQFTSEEGNE